VFQVTGSKHPHLTRCAIVVAPACPTVLQFYPRCFMTTDAIFEDDVGSVKYHFVISQMVCWASPDASPTAGDDAKAIRWMSLSQIRKLHVS
jgi:predicted NAD/FAD-dependent oxidoreductase